MIKVNSQLLVGVIIFLGLMILGTTLSPNPTAQAIGRQQASSDFDLQHLGAQFVDLETVSGSEAWALTRNDRFYRYNGSQWVLQPELDDAVIYDIEFLSNGEGWAAGYIPSITNFGVDGAIWRYNGSSWQVQTVPGVSQINALDMFSPTAGFAVSAEATLRYSNGNWQVLQSDNTPDLTDISSASASTLWGIGPGGVYFFDGSQWFNILTSTNIGLTTLLNDIVFSNGLGWAVGCEGQGDEQTVAGCAAKILHYNGSTWVEEASGVNVNLHDATVAPDGTVWAVGDEGTILRRDNNGVWQPVSSGTDEALWHISMSSGTQGWTGGEDAILLEYNGAGWQNRTNLITPKSLTDDPIHAVSMLSETEGYAVGGSIYDDESVLFKYDGSQWTSLITTADDILMDIKMINSTTGWVVGGNDTDQAAHVYSFDGSSLTPVTIPAGISQTLQAVDLTPDGSAGWAVGSDDTGNVGVILRYSSGTWTDDTPGAGVAGLNDVAVVSATEAWAVGEENSLLHFTGGSWNAVNLDLDDKFHLSAVSMLDANEGWAVGRFESGPSETGLFLHYSGGNWEPVSVEGDVVSTSDISAQDLDRSGLLDTIELHDVVMVSASEGYAVGDNGSILKYNGTGWQVISQGSASSLRAAAVTSSGLQVVGTNANILRVARVSGPLANTTYLPMVFRNPIPTRTPTSIPTPSRSKPEVLYYHDFRDTHHQWPHYTTSGIVGGDCKSLRDGGRYVLLTPSYSRHPCFRFAPEDANYRYGVFEARGYRAGGSDLLEWGIYVNGRGGSEYYLFRIRPGVNCGWEFVKREHDHDDVKRRGGCTGINKGANAIRIQHDRRGSSDVFALFINRQFVGEYSDRAGLNGDGTGFYLQARSSDYAEVRFDYFQVLSVPQ